MSSRLSSADGCAPASGGDPIPGEGPPAAVRRVNGDEVLRGVKTFCSGAGGLDRALVLARNPDGGPPLAVWIDLTDAQHVDVDESWYRSHGLRASVSHRVVFYDAPVLARLGGPGALSAQPWFARDALRTAATWAGMADTALDSALGELARRPARGALEAVAAGRMLTAHRTIGCGSAPPAGRWTRRRATCRRSRCMPALRSLTPAGRCSTRRRGHAGPGRSPALTRSTERGATSRCSCSSTGSTRCSLAPGRRNLSGAEQPCQQPTSRPAIASPPRPLGYTESAYEHEKYAATLAACGPGPFTCALELGSSIGVFSALLAPRCRRLVSIDAAPTAVASARRRLVAHPQAETILGPIPAAVPDEGYDLVVASEILYYLTAELLADTLGAARFRMLPGARLVAVHWRPHGPERPLSAEQVHATLRQEPWLVTSNSAATDDYLLDILVRR